MDVAIKLFLILSLLVAVISCQKLLSLMIIGLAALAIIFFSKINRGILFRNLIYYAVILVLPYFFGIIISLLTSSLRYNPELVFVKIIRLYLFGLLGGLFFLSTSIEVMASLCYKFLSPLQKLDIPVADSLKSLILIIDQIEKNISKFHDLNVQKITDKVRYKGSIRAKVQQVTQTFVTIIVNSFQKTEEVRRRIEQQDQNILNSYQFKPSMADAVGIFVFVLVVVTLIVLEREMLTTTMAGGIGHLQSTGI